MNLEAVDLVLEDAQELCELLGVFRRAAKKPAKQLVRRSRSKEIASSSFVRPDKPTRGISLSQAPSVKTSDIARKAKVAQKKNAGKPNADMWDQVYGKRAISDDIEALDALITHLVESRFG